MSVKQNFVTGKGETFDLHIVYKDANGDPIALNTLGHTVDFVVVKSKTGAAVGTYSAEVTDGGGITISVPDETTATWPVGKLAHRVVHTDAAGDKRWLIYGALTVIDGDDV